jgi:hypothetical protein
MEGLLQRPEADSLWNAANAGNADEVGRILSIPNFLQYFDFNAKFSEKVCTSLHIAVFMQHLEVVRLMLSMFPRDVRKKMVRVCDVYNATPLHDATRSDNTAMVELLLNAGAFANGKDVFGTTALHNAARNGNAQMVIALFYAFHNYAPINAQNNNGCTPLHYAASQGHSHVVQMLLLMGADDSLKDTRGLTAEEYAEGAFCLETATIFGMERMERQRRGFTVNSQALDRKRIYEIAESCKLAKLDHPMRDAKRDMPPGVPIQRRWPHSPDLYGTYHVRR